MKLNEKIIALRRENGLSQEALAEKLGVSRQAVSRWEQGTALPDSLNLLGLSKLFGVSADYLLNDDYESDKDIPVAAVVKSETQAEENRKKAFLILSILNLFQVVVFAIAPTNVIFPFMGTLASAVLLISFELGWRKAGGTRDSDGEKYHVAFYILTVWLALFMPLNRGFRALIGIYTVATKRALISEMSPAYVILGQFIIPFLLYAVICLALTVVIRKLAMPKK